MFLLDGIPFPAITFDPSLKHQTSRIMSQQYFKAIVTEKCPHTGKVVGDTKSKGRYHGMTREQLAEAIPNNFPFTCEIVEIEPTATDLIAELNEIRRTQKQISDFKSVAEWLEYGKEIATEKARILGQIEKLCQTSQQ